MSKIIYCQNTNSASDKKRSTELAATLLLDFIRKGVDSGQYTGAIYVDLSKAFDTINHATILNKLPTFGITGIALDWFTNYLFDRSQSVAIDDVLSEPTPILCGVPQGSILGPVLFLLLFNDSPSSLKNCNILKYADDTVLYVTHKDINVVRDLLNKNFCSFCSWLDENQLLINTKRGKTEFMVFGSSKRLKQLKNRLM